MRTIRVYVCVKLYQMSFEKTIGRIDEIIAYIKDNPKADTSDIIGWLLLTMDGIDCDNPVSIVDEYDEDDE